MNHNIFQQVLKTFLTVLVILKKYQKYQNSYMISMDSMLYDIELDREITYFDIPLYGNFGYNGVDRLESQILEMHGDYIFLQDSLNPQYLQEVCDFVRKNGVFVEEVEGYDIYQIP